MHLYVINLKEAIDRRKSIEKQLKELGLDFTVFEAIKGSSLSIDELEKLVDMQEVQKYPDWLTPNMLGAALSHLGVYKSFLNTNLDWALILEDDVLLNKDIKLLIDHIIENENIYINHLILFYGVIHEGSLELSRNEISRTGSYSFHEVLSTSVGGAGAYIIHRSVAKKLVDSINKIKVAPDTWDYFKTLGAFTQINCIYPFAAKPGLFESTIGYVNKKSFSFKIKHFVEKYKVPLLYQLLRRNRKTVWEKTSKIEFV